MPVQHDAKCFKEDKTLSHEVDYPQLRKALGDPVLDPELLVLALTHRSYAFEQGGLPTNERLEFLGDSVLGMVVTEWLYHDHPYLPEGKLARLRAAVVNSRALADVARSLGLGPEIYLGKGEASTGGADKPSILADTMEAVIGAVFLSAGVEEARDFIRRTFASTVAAAVDNGAGLDWKTALQELAAAEDLGAVEYRVTFVGPDHARDFTAQAWVGEEHHGTGTGTSKKIAEQVAAEEAFTTLSSEHADDAECPVNPANQDSTANPA